MAQTSSMVSKRRILWDGVEIEGLVSSGAVRLEDGIVEVPELQKITKIGNGITTMPEVPFTYQVKRNGSAMAFFQDFHRKRQEKDCIVIYVDAGGTEYARDLLHQCECTFDEVPEYDAANPTYAKINFNAIPKFVDSIQGG